MAIEWSLPTKKVKKLKLSLFKKIRRLFTGGCECGGDWVFDEDINMGTIYRCPRCGRKIYETNY